MDTGHKERFEAVLKSASLLHQTDISQPEVFELTVKRNGSFKIDEHMSALKAHILDAKCVKIRAVADASEKACQIIEMLKAELSIDKSRISGHVNASNELVFTIN